MAIFTPFQGKFKDEFLEVQFMELIIAEETGEIKGKFNLQNGNFPVCSRLKHH
jgi:hypothetical protein